MRRRDFIKLSSVVGVVGVVGSHLDTAVATDLEPGNHHGCNQPGMYNAYAKRNGMQKVKL